MCTLFEEAATLGRVTISSARIVVDPDKGECFYAGPQFNYAGTNSKEIEETFPDPLRD